MKGCSHGGVYSVNPRMVRVDFSSNVNPLGAPKKAIRVIEKNIDFLAPIYPDPECRDLKRSISRLLGIDPSHITVANGAVEIIYWFAYAFCEKRVVIPAPSFCEYELAAKKAGASVTFVPLTQNFELDPDAVIKSARGAAAIFLCNPNNPTGILSTNGIRKIIENVNISTKILLDECFVEMVDRPAANTMLGKISKHDNLVILRSLTKSHGMAGLRVGYSISSLALADKLSTRKIPWNVNGLAQAAGIAALADKKHVARARALIKKEGRFLFDAISKLRSFIPLRSDANYFLIQLKNRDSTQLRDTLLKKTGILVRDCSTFTGMDTHHIRVAIRTRKENVFLLKALEALDFG